MHTHYQEDISSELRRGRDRHNYLPVCLDTRNNHGNVTLTGLRDALVEEVLRYRPAKGFLLDKVEFEFLCGACQ